MNRTVFVLSGVNLGRLGDREPEVYGRTTYDELARSCVAWAAEHGLVADVRQTDDEAVLLGWLREAAAAGVPVVLNAGAWSHYSGALHDAAAALTAPLVEVHISNTAAREPFRHHSVLSAVATGSIVGLGIDGYRLALLHLAARVRAGT